MYPMNEDMMNKVKSYLKKGDHAKQVQTEEGYKVLCFNPEVEKEFIVPKFSPKDVARLRNFLTEKGALNITVGEKGFVSAANRIVEGEDKTNYDAIWVRDSAWIYEGLKAQSRKDDAKRVVLALWDYYATSHQRARMEAIHKDPASATDQMKVPHIRFDAKSPDLDDVHIEENGKIIRQEWNHKQNDAHGLFLLALADAVVELGVSSEEVTTPRAKALALLFRYFADVKYESFEESGAWEEVDAVRASSVGLVANAHIKWDRILENKDKSAFSARLNEVLASFDDTVTSSLKNLKNSHAKGLHLVTTSLAKGGESPEFDKDHILYRGADSALLHLLTPYKLEGLTESQEDKILELVTSLEREAGVLRYEKDSYQAMGYAWLADGSLLHGTSEGHFAARARLFDQFGPGTEPHWFFDSMLAISFLDMAANRPNQKDEYVSKAVRAIKRNLGQLTGSQLGTELMCSDASRPDAFRFPESINVVLIDGKKHFIPSYIVPLNWPISCLSLALQKLEAVS